MPRYQHENIIRDNPPGQYVSTRASTPMPAGPGYSCLAERQEKDLTTACMEMLKVFTEEMMKSLKDNYEDINNGRKGSRSEKGKRINKENQVRKFWKWKL